MRISIEGWKEAGRDLPNTVGKTSLFTKAIIEKYGQGDNYVFDPAMMVYLVKAEPQPEEEKKSPSEERAKEYVIREKEVLKLVTQQEKSREFLTRIMKTSTIPGGRELLKRKSFRQQFAIWVQAFIRDYQDYVQNIFPNTNTIYEAKAEIQKELVVLTETLELWRQATNLKESSYQKEIEKHVQKIRQKRENLEKQEYMQKVQRIILREMENIDREEEKDFSELELNYLVKSSIMELTEEERKELYRELLDILNVREKQHKFRTTGSNVWKYLESLQSVYLEEILLKTLERKEERSSLEETYLPLSRILTLEEWERENILSVEESAVREEKTERELRHLVRNRLMEMSEEERQEFYRELVSILDVREEQRMLYQKRAGRTMSWEEEEKLSLKLQTIREQELEHLKRVQTVYLENVEIKEKLAVRLEEELFKTLEKRKEENSSEEKTKQKLHRNKVISQKEEILKKLRGAYLEEVLLDTLEQKKETSALEEVQLSQNRILTHKEWESVVQGEKIKQKLHHLVRDSLMELSGEERQELYQELVNIKEVRKEQRELYEKLLSRTISREEEENVLQKLHSIRENKWKHLEKVQTTYFNNVEKTESFTNSIEETLLKTLERGGEEHTSEESFISQDRILTREEWERKMIHRTEESEIQKEKTEQDLHHSIRSSLMELSGEERQELYQELVNIKEVRKEQRELYEKLLSRTMSREEEENVLQKLQMIRGNEGKYIKKVQTEYLEKIGKKESFAVSVEEALFKTLERRQEESILEQDLHLLVRNNLMEMSEEERQEFYRKLTTVRRAEEIEQVLSHRTGITQSQEQTLIRELQTIFLQQMKKKEILVEMPKEQRSYMQASLLVNHAERVQKTDLERELIQSEENQTVQSEKDGIERFYYNRSQVENIEKIRMEQREQFLNLQEISRQQGEQLEKMEIQQKELKEKLERAKQNPYEQEQKVIQKLENQLRLEQLRRGLA